MPDNRVLGNVTLPTDSGRPFFYGKPLISRSKDIYAIVPFVRFPEVNFSEAKYQAFLEEWRQENADGAVDKARVDAFNEKSKEFSQLHEMDIQLAIEKNYELVFHPTEALVGNELSVSEEEF